MIPQSFPRMHVNSHIVKTKKLNQLFYSVFFFADAIAEQNVHMPDLIAHLTG